MPRRLPHREGDQVGVPIGAAWAIGVIARVGQRGNTLGYFFGPALDALPRAPISLPPRDAVYVTLFGDLGLTEGTWAVLGPTPGFDRALWPVPAFGRPIELLPGRANLEIYDEALNLIVHRVVPVESIEGLPENGFAGSGFLEAKLAHLLGVARPTQREAVLDRRPMVFELDDAMDWVPSLLRSKGERALEAAFAAALRGGYVELPAAAVAVAAAEAAAAALGFPAVGLPSAVATWAESRASTVSTGVIQKALGAIARVRHESELQELFATSESAEAWSASMSDLERRLTSVA